MWNRIKACIMDEPSQHETSCFDKIGIGIVGQPITYQCNKITRIKGHISKSSLENTIQVIDHKTYLT